jgi:hypothetical protein
MDFLTATQVVRYVEHAPDGSSWSLSMFRRAGKAIGGVLIRTRPDRSFTMQIDVNHRSGYFLESLFFDCKTSKDGPIYTAMVPSDVAEPQRLLPPVGAPLPASSTGAVDVRGGMTPLGRSNYLLRVDVTNSDTEADHPTVQFDLAGYAVDGFPTLPSGTSCEAAEGLVCSIDTVLPGQTRTIVLMLHQDGAVDRGEVVEIAVASFGLRDFRAHIGMAPVKRRAVITDFYELARS